MLRRGSCAVGFAFSSAKGIRFSPDSIQFRKFSSVRPPARIKERGGSSAVAINSLTNTSSSQLLSPLISSSIVFRQKNSEQIRASHKKSTFFPTRYFNSRGQSSCTSEVNSTEPVIQEGELSQNVFDVLKERGLMDAVTSEELREVVKRPIKAYVGFDPTAESLHLGNLLGLIALAWFGKFGHCPVALIGGATARVGDPSGKSLERPILSEEEIERNSASIERVIQAIISRAVHPSPSPSSTPPCFPRLLILDNFTWWREFSLLSFLRDVGKYARVGAMVSKESVRKRLNSEEGMSYAEFSYQLLQGYDFVHLYGKHGVVLQMGGSDQWGNITAGTDLIRKLRVRKGGDNERDSSDEEEGQSGAQSEGPNGGLADASPALSSPTFGLTWPLLLKSDGSKFGKSEEGAIWLSKEMLSPYKFYQYLFATPDADVINFLKMLTFLDLSDIGEIAREMKREGYSPNKAQKILAMEVTRFVHGEEGLNQALQATAALSPGQNNTRLDVSALRAISDTVPNVSLSLSEIADSSLIDLAVVSGLFKSKGAARRLLKQGGLYLNNEKVEEEGKLVREEDIVGGEMLLISAGKKNKVIVRVQNVH